MLGAVMTSPLTLGGSLVVASAGVTAIAAIAAAEDSVPAKKKNTSKH